MIVRDLFTVKDLFGHRGHAGGKKSST